MTVSYYNKLWWSAIGDPEDYSTPDSGFLNISEAGGAITGLAKLGDYFFVFQENIYTVYQKRIGDIPFNRLTTWEYGCNSEPTIKEINGWLYYLSSEGDIRKTNGISDICLSDAIRPTVKTIINGRSVSDYYGGQADAMPCAEYDRYNNAYRLFYAGSSSYNDKSLTYFIDAGIWLQADGIYVSATAPVDDDTTYLAVLGNSNAGGVTYNLVAKYSDPNKAGTFDSGWVTASNPKNGIKIYEVTVWAHADAGTGGASCNTSITATVYKDPETNTAYAAETQTLAYNSVADNLIKLTFSSLACQGDYVRVKITDSGSGANYSIDKVVVNFDQIYNIS
jgi:hypothetical protein